MRYEELTIEGRNAVIEAFRSGKTIDRVFILDAAEGITPYKKAVLDADLEEERRMFYVAMTRAKKELTICWAKKQFSHELTVSRFVEEMKDDRAV